MLHVFINLTSMKWQEYRNGDEKSGLRNQGRNWNENEMRAGGMTHVIQHLPTKREALSSNPRTATKIKLKMKWHECGSQRAAWETFVVIRLFCI
jgi:hypothetical protein